MAQKAVCGLWIRDTRILNRISFSLNRCFALTVAVCVLSDAHAAWLDAAWPHRQKITIAGTLATVGTLTNFPVLVQIIAQDNPVFRKTQTNAQDIVFTAADGVTRLAHEIDSFRPNEVGNQALNAWVRVPELAPGVETVLYLYYGNPAVSDQQDRGTVWAEYAGVWHLEEERSGLNPALQLYRDSTTNGYHGTDNVSTNRLGGRVGNGSGMDGDDYIQFNRKLYTTNDFTVTAWVNPERLSWEAVAGDNSSRYLMLFSSSQMIGRSAVSNETHTETYGSGANLVTGVWQHVTFRSTGVEGDIRGFYKNGTQLSASSTPVLNLPLAADPWYMIGKFSSYYFHGVLDEVRISDKALPQAWLDAEYRNVSSPSAYVTVGKEEGAVYWPAAYFTYRQEVAVAPSVTQVLLTNFPMLVAITNAANPLFTFAAADGGDILFTAADGVTPLPHEIERYRTSAPASLYAWVRLPVLYPAALTRFYLYYGRTGAFTALNRTNVWSEGYLGVWHLGEPVTHGQTNYDSTVSAAHGVFQDGSARGGGDAAGKIAGADAFQGFEDHYVLTPGVQCSSNGFTVSAWVWDANTNDYSMYEGGSVDPSYSGINKDLHPICSITTLTTQRTVTAYNTYIQKDRWYYLALLATPTQSQVYIDGTLTSSSVSYTALDPLRRAKYIGRCNISKGYCFDGTVDELRVSGVLRSAEWLKTCYLTQNEPGAALSFRPPEYCAPNGTLITVQ